MVKIFLSSEIRIGKNLENLKELGFPIDVLNAVRKLKGCIYLRLKIFDEEVKLQPDGYVVIYASIAKIEYFYKGELGRRMSESISESDFRYCLSLVEDVLAQLN